jgi:DNA-directed RNA polymerase specialized sigma24 family protein
MVSFHNFYDLACYLEQEEAPASPDNSITAVDMTTTSSFVVEIYERAIGFIYKALWYRGFEVHDPNSMEDIKHEFMLKLLGAKLDPENPRVYGLVKRLVHHAVIDWIAKKSLVYAPRRNKDKAWFKVKPLSKHVAAKQPIEPPEEHFKLTEAIDKLKNGDLVRKAYGLGEPITSVSALARESNLSRATIRNKLANAFGQIKKMMTKEVELRLCAYCGTVLVGKQEKFCSRQHKQHFRLHKRTTSKDQPFFKSLAMAG